MSETELAIQAEEIIQIAEAGQEGFIGLTEAATTTTTNKRKRVAAAEDDLAEAVDSSNKRAFAAKDAAADLNGKIAALAHSSSIMATESAASGPEREDLLAEQLVAEATAQQSSNEAASQTNGEPAAAADATSTAAAALAGIYPTMTVPQPTDVAFAVAGEGDRSALDPSFNMGENAGDLSFDMSAMDASTGSNGQKPAVGSDAWHRVRRDNHKEGEHPNWILAPCPEFRANIPSVERRRRETINEGINELAKIVPGCEKNKGSILQRAVAFITQLKENEAQNIEKWTLEKLLTEQAIAELSGSVDKLKNECDRAWREAETWKKTCQSAGLSGAEEKEDKLADAICAEGQTNGEA